MKKTKLTSSFEAIALNSKIQGIVKSMPCLTTTNQKKKINHLPMDISQKVFYVEKNKSNPMVQAKLANIKKNGGKDIPTISTIVLNECLLKSQSIEEVAVYLSEYLNKPVLDLYTYTVFILSQFNECGYIVYRNIESVGKNFNNAFLYTDF